MEKIFVVNYVSLIGDYSLYSEAKLFYDLEDAKKQFEDCKLDVADNVTGKLKFPTEDECKENEDCAYFVNNIKQDKDRIFEWEYQDHYIVEIREQVIH